MLLNILKILFSDGICRGLNFLVTLVLVSHLSVADFGIYNYILVIVGLSALTFDPMFSAYSRDFKFFEYERYNMGLIVIALIFAIPFYLILDKFVYAMPFTLFAVLYLPLLLSSNIKTYLNVYGKYNRYSIANMLQNFAVLITTLIFVFFVRQFNITSLLYCGYLFATFVVIIFSIFCLKNNKSLEFDLSLKKIYEFTMGSIYLFFYGATLPIISFLDLYFVNKYLNSYDLGIYSFSLKVYTIALIGLSPMLTVFRLHFIDIFKNNNVRSHIKRNFLNVLFIAFLLLCLSLVGNYLLVNIIFTKYIKSFWPTNILLFSAFFSYVLVPFIFLAAARRYKQMFCLGILGLLANISINICFIRKFGLIVPSISVLVAQGIMNGGAFIVTYVLFVRKKSVS